MNTMKTETIFQDFVVIDVCAILFKMGLCAQVNYSWVVNEKREGTLTTFAFDPDKVYAQMFVNDCYAKEVAGIETIVYPAYTISDMEKLLPDFLISRTAGMYELMLDNNYPAEPVQAQRLPDAFAAMVTQLIKKRFINPTAAVAVLNKTA